MDLFQEFMLRGECGLWNPVFLYIYAISNLLITAAYVAIPLSLMVPKPKHGTELDDSFVIISYCAFILTCGLGHIENVVFFAYAPYHMAAIWHLFTALISWNAVIVTFRNRNKVLRIIG